MTLTWFALNLAFYVVVALTAYARGRARERRETATRAADRIIKYYRWMNDGKPRD